jgi:hypothetical protein
MAHSVGSSRARQSVGILDEAAHSLATVATELVARNLEGLKVIHKSRNRNE